MPATATASKFVGFDLSLNGTGVAILRHTGEGWLEPELHTLRQKHKGPVTKTYQTARLCQIIEDMPFDAFNFVTLAALEDYAMGAGKVDKDGNHNSNCTFQLGEIGGIVRYLLYTDRTPFIPVPLTVNKKFATGNGQADKFAVAAAMSRLWELPTFKAKELDCSDALSLATVAAFRYFRGLPGKTTHKYQLQIIEPLEVVCREE